ncbi:monovalent cation:proton antiporter family protein [Macrococcoides caseolyticum]|uniref:monovalent cation:proton antiporter family protein n=1 Tax=Macrococcoides caseolyticum TaxID=69966 RepID=UPI000C33E1B1|nr:monovalent cation:proton antiporter family protein [Macrococcus caseolyticus]PKE49607.1 sodium:proton antiporter [Macrococcus caseolyticus]TDM19460.1 sodium:proton antiporter [Macrococcus caseolyticus]VUC67639.1 Na+/H+ antiporter protein [Macrococcus caseolyticus]
MENHGQLISLVVVVVCAFLTPILLNRLRITFLPVVVAEILMGIIVGKSLFNWVERTEMLNILSTLGFIFLMFLSGLEIDFKTFKSKSGTKKGKEPNPLILTLSIFLGILLLSIGAAYLFKWAGLVDDVLLMVIIISTISLGVVVPTLKEMNLMQTSIGQIILLVAVIADLATILLLTLYGTLHAEGDSPVWLIGILVVFTALFYVMGNRLKKLEFLHKLMAGTTQIGIRAVFALILLLVALAESVGAENILGAFLAGCVVSLLGPDKDMVDKLDSFGYGFFIPIFFIMVGVDLDIPSLFKDPSKLVLIPILFIVFYLTKAIPLTVLLKWYDRQTVLASTFLLTATLSLVIASAKIAERLGAIDGATSGTLILAAVITCVIVPIFFKKLFPVQLSQEKVIRIAFIGNNQLSIPVAQSFKSALYIPTIIYRKNNDARQISDIDVIEVDEYTYDELNSIGLFDFDIVVCSANDESINRSVALMAKEEGVERVICRVESKKEDDELLDADIEIFSEFQSTKTLLKGLIESPNMLNLLSNVETSLYEIEMLNTRYHEMRLREFPFSGDIIFVRILRGKDSIVPHGETELHFKDRLIVTGSREYVDEIKRELELF